MAKRGMGLVSGGQNVSEGGNESGGQEGSKKPERSGRSKKDKGEKIPARKRVRNAQLQVLGEVENILKGNCKSAKKGNHGCAKFVLDWALVSDLRAPLARPTKRQSLSEIGRASCRERV